MSFTGEFRHTIDAKGRLIVPSRLREELVGGTVVLSKWLDGCIAMWSATGWAEIEARLRSQGSSGDKARALVRRVASSAYPDEVDKQGRVSVPAGLREHAEIDKDVVVIGALSHGEIWSPQRWEQQTGSVEAGRLEDLATGLDF